MPQERYTVTIVENGSWAILDDDCNMAANDIKPGPESIPQLVQAINGTGHFRQYRVKTDNLRKLIANVAVEADEFRKKGKKR